MSLPPRLLAIGLLLAAHAFAAKPPPHFGAVPEARQLAWQRMEYYAFVHFGLNTYTGREWGYGSEDPRLFNPLSFDARVIVKQFKDAGMKGMILTAKHHDGFCLWPTKTTTHNITQSPWKNGTGDMLKDFSDACKAEGMKFGIYLSPWDRNNAQYARAAYVATYHEQVREVLAGYGPVFEMWFDGANGGYGYYGGAKEHRRIPQGYYQFPKLMETIRSLQPRCVVWGAGDARWGGSEDGEVNYPQWHTMDTMIPGDIASGVPHGDLWCPAEADVSIRPGWFWHKSEDDDVKTPEELMDIWFKSVGRGANLILNVPPDRDGLLRPGDVASLNGLRDLRNALFSVNLAAGATATGPMRGGDVFFSPANLTDDAIDSYWAPDDGTVIPTVEMVLKSEATFDVIRLREQIRRGQRVDAFGIDAWVNGAWKEIHSGKTIGHQVLVRLDTPVTTSRVRLRITKAAATPCISEFSLYRMPVLAAQ